jgi:peptide-methionine (S)-S-oxide reductase
VTEKATFGGGCFWGIEDAFRQVPGVVDVVVGYTGGHTDNPTYPEVCSHTSGHAEVAEVTFDPELVTYEQLLDLFWRIHDPTQLDRQGPDIGDQYRSAIYFHSPEHEKAALTSRDDAQPEFSRPIVTEITAVPRFWPAEEYHQRYFEKHGVAGCHVPRR